MHEENKYTIVYGGKNFELPGIGICNTVICEDDGEVPHFHILSKDKSFSLGICLLDASYYDHNNTNYKLNSEQIEILISHLTFTDPSYGSIWNWLLILYYESNENEYTLPHIDDFTSINLMPDYRNLINK